MRLRVIKIKTPVKTWLWIWEQWWQRQRKWKTERERKVSQRKKKPEAMCSFLSAAWVRQWPWSLHEGEAAVTTSKLRPLVSSHHQSRETKATEGGNVTLHSSKLHHLRKLNLLSWCWYCPEALSFCQFLRRFMLCIFHFVCTVDIKILQHCVLTQFCNQKTLFTHYIFGNILYVAL